MKFKHKATVIANQAKSDIENENWQTVLEIYVKGEPLCDSRMISLENINFGNILSEEYYLFHTRYVDKIKVNMRIKFDGNIYEIKRLINQNFANRILKIITLKIS